MRKPAIIALVLAQMCATPSLSQTLPAATSVKEGNSRNANGVYPDSRFRLPLPKREEMTAEGQSVYDRAIGIAQNAARGKSGAGTGLNGPSGILLYSPRLADLSIQTNYYLRFGSGLDDRLREIAILAVAREADNDFEWTQHEVIARRVGVSDAALHVLGKRLPVTGLPDDETTIIKLVRESVTDHHVSVATYDKALALLGPQKLVDMMNVIGSYLANAAVLTAFGMTLAADQPSLLPARAAIAKARKKP